MTSQLLRTIPLPKEFIPFTEELTWNTINQRFNIIASQFSQKIAITNENKTLTYSESKIWIDKVAELLINILGTAGEPKGVGVIFEPCIESILGMMGVIASGHFFIPISPHDPIDRIKFYLADASVHLIISTQSSLSTQLETALSEYKIFLMEDIAGNPIADLYLDNLDSTRICALLYTSGSTGQPKGTIHTNETLIKMVRFKTNNLGISPTDHIGGLSEFTFGGYFSNFLLALLNGSTLHLYNLRLHTFRGIGRWIRKKSISYFHCTPTTLRFLLAALPRPTNFPKLRLVTLGGEIVRIHDIRRFQEIIASPTILGTTGATIETWVFSNCFFGRPFPNSIVNVPMGFIHPDCDVQIWNEHDQPPAQGDRGEIIVNSPCLSPGYWQSPELNCRKFTIGSNLQTYFRTGDIGRIDEQGILYHHGRLDLQVKIRGIRIETGEIENVLLTYPTIDSAVVITTPDYVDELQLIAYLIPKKGSEFTRNEILTFLRMHLPDYMLPNRMILLDEFPLTRTGKIDRKPLANPTQFEEFNQPLTDPPSTSLQHVIFDIWSEVLGHSNYGVSDLFILSGGNSIGVMLIRNRINTKFEVDIPMKLFLDYETIEDLANAIEPLLEQVSGN